ncbi:MAG: hypothetical protein KKA97_02595 [Actinobacteria bacterium]|nr:hypothetical protein [Actinomycetota bacterium]
MEVSAQLGSGALRVTRVEDQRLQRAEQVLDELTLTVGIPALCGPVDPEPQRVRY